MKQSKRQLEAFRTKLEAFAKEPHIAGTVDEFHGHKETYSGLWVSGESGFGLPLVIDGEDFGTTPAFDYWGLMKYGGVDERMRKFLEKHGYHPEWYDPGTMMLYKD